MHDGEGRVRALDFHDHAPRLHRLLARAWGAVALGERPVPPGVADALGAYFEGRLCALAGVPTLSAGTPFQERVWAALRQIPPGEVRSYGALAAALGRAGAARAVGLANARNPIALLVPCHRVVGADGALTGFAGGVGRKRWLLDHEGAARPPGRSGLTPAKAPGARPPPDPPG